jgi:tetratricopeptide (TPR) repeat protein
VEALAGNRKGAIASAHASLGILDDYNNKLHAGSVLAFAGESKKALDLAAEVVKNRPDDVMVQSVYAPVVRATVALNRDDAAKAIELLKPASGYDKNNSQVLYFRGLAYWKVGRELKPRKSFRRFWLFTALLPPIRLCLMLNWGWDALMLSRVIPRKAALPTRTSLHCGKTPTPTSPS